MTIGIIGSTGLIGSKLTLGLIEAGHHVIAITRSKGKANSLFQGRAIEHVWDGSDPATLLPVVEKADAMVNLAGETLASGRWTHHKKKIFYDSRIGVTNALSEAINLAATKPSLIIQGSAIGVYGLNYDGVSDVQSIQDSYLSDLCKEWELAIQPTIESSIPVAIIRTGVVLNRNEGMLAKVLPLFKLHLGGHTGHGKQWISWIHIDDMVNAIMYILDLQLSGIYNVTAPGPLTQRNFFRILGKVLKKPSWFHVPAFILKLVYGKMAVETVLASQRVLPDHLLESGFSFKYPDLESALMNILNQN